ncbi:hypothetical protein M9Y10_016982 [Tritrichomonas musculus]|uniref:DUF3447 domain-containing protein n=1 Tax=Tritrichomonas musculus TaxID=1915356 RepID=A0ABR2HXT9_9EUKA
MKDIQKSLLDYLDNENFNEELSQSIITFFSNQKVKGSKQELKSVLYLISNIADNHHRNIHFFPKIFEIILFFRNEIKKYFTNNEIFNIFKNKRILLFLSNEKIITFDRSSFNKMRKRKDSSQLIRYFHKELFEFIPKDKLLDYNNFPKNRDENENTSQLCKIIQKDSIDDFIQFVNQNNIRLDSNVYVSLVDSNSFLFKNDLSLIEYSAFFGSIQIFKYLFLNKVRCDRFLWQYAIHGNNFEIIHILEEMKFEFFENFNFVYLCYEEAVKCHHNEIANYFLENYLDESYSKKNSYSFLAVFMNYYNFEFIELDDLKNISILNAVEFDYDYFAEYLLKNNNIVLNCEKNDEKNKSVLNMAVDNDNIELLKLILNFDNVDINNIYEHKSVKRTSFHDAIENENLEIAKLLLSNKNLDTNIYKTIYYPRSKEIQTAFHLAAYNGSVEMFQFLLSCKKVDINLPSIITLYRFSREHVWKSSALNFAVKNNQIEIVKILLSCKEYVINDSDIFLKDIYTSILNSIV